jgi:predicted kinase
MGNRMKVLVLFVGIPGSGKTTLCKRLFPNVNVISPDKFIKYTEEEPWSFDTAMEAWREAYRLLIESIDDVIVFDATLLNKKRRKKYIQFARQNNRVPIAIFCNTPFDICKQRNDLRDKFRKVPDDRMEAFANILVPPTIEEGFYKIITENSICGLIDSNKKYSIPISFSNWSTGG